MDSLEALIKQNFKSFIVDKCDENQVTFRAPLFSAEEWEECFLDLQELTLISWTVYGNPHRKTQTANFIKSYVCHYNKHQQHRTEYKKYPAGLKPNTRFVFLKWQ